jgi:hypothetical protein
MILGDKPLISEVVLSQPPRSPEYLLIHSHPSHPVILHLLTLSFLTQSQIKVLINFPM